MDLFVVNRHLDAETPVENDEQIKLNATLSRIEKNRLKNLEKKKKEKLRIQTKRKLIDKRIVAKDLKIVKVPVQNEGLESENEESKKTRKKKFKKAKVASGTEINGFTILGEDDFKKKTKVSRVLPRWLSDPKFIPIDLHDLKTKVSSVKELNKDLRKKLREDNIKYLFPVQVEVIPHLLESIKIRKCLQPNDICVSAPTGSGKTLAFVLPIIQALCGNVVRNIRALIILPTQDLAKQVFKTFKRYADGTNLKVLLVTGSVAFEQEQEQLVMKNSGFGYLSKVDILVSTAGRLVDHIKTTPGFTLEHLEYLVIDEADRVLDNIQNDWLYHLEKHIYSEEKFEAKILTIQSVKTRKAPQKLLFSATLSQDPEKLQKLGLFQPKLFTSVVKNEDKEENFVVRYATPKELTEKYIVSKMETKPLVLYEFIRQESLTKTLVFAYSSESTHRLRLLLQALFKETLKIEEIGSKLDPQLRKKLIEDFSQGNIDVLVCTDALARGIDLPSVRCVINYSAPKHLETYIHRAGRTARAGEQGLCVTILTESQLGQFKGFISQGGKDNVAVEEIKIDEQSLEPLLEEYKEALATLKETVHSESKEKTKKLFASKRLQFKRKRKMSS